MDTKNTTRRRVLLLGTACGAGAMLAFCGENRAAGAEKPATGAKKETKEEIVSPAEDLMYRPHEAREDTVLFPAFRELVPAESYWALGEEFEHKEHELFGEEGFHKIVAQVAELEKKLGIYDLDQFTPPT